MSGSLIPLSPVILAKLWGTAGDSEKLLPGNGCADFNLDISSNGPENHASGPGLGLPGATELGQDVAPDDVCAAPAAPLPETDRGYLRRLRRWRSIRPATLFRARRAN